MAKRRSSAYVNALTKYYKQNVKGHFLEKAKLTIEDSKLFISKTALRHKAVYSNLDGFWAGTIYGAFNQFPKEMYKNLNIVSSDMMSSIFAMSQRLVPIDKKYIGLVSAGDFGELKRPRSYLIPSKEERFEQIRSYDHNTVAQLAYKYRDPEEFYLGKHSTRLDLPAGNYYNNGLIKDFFLSSNKRSRWQLYIDKEGNIGSFYEGAKKRAKIFGNIKDIKPINPKDFRITTKEITGGNKELKKGGKLYKKRGMIIYSSKLGGAEYEYAQVQHDNLAYKHATGKQALYLYDSFEYYRKKFAENLKAGTVKAFARTFGKNQGVTSKKFDYHFEQLEEEKRRRR